MGDLSTSISTVDPCHAGSLNPVLDSRPEGTADRGHTHSRGPSSVDSFHRGPGTTTGNRRESSGTRHSQSPRRKYGSRRAPSTPEAGRWVTHGTLPHRNGEIHAHRSFPALHRPPGTARNHTHEPRAITRQFGTARWRIAHRLAVSGAEETGELEADELGPLIRNVVSGIRDRHRYRIEGVPRASPSGPGAAALRGPSVRTVSRWHRSLPTMPRSNVLYQPVPLRIASGES